MNEAKMTVTVDAPEVVSALAGAIQLVERGVAFNASLLSADFQLAVELAELRKNAALIAAVQSELTKRINQLEERQRAISSCGSRNYRY